MDCNPEKQNDFVEKAVLVGMVFLLMNCKLLFCHPSDCDSILMNESFDSCLKLALVNCVV